MLKIPGVVTALGNVFSQVSLDFQEELVGHRLLVIRGHGIEDAEELDVHGHKELYLFLQLENKTIGNLCAHFCQ